MSTADFVFTITDQTSGTVSLAATPYAWMSGGGMTADRKAATVGETLEMRLKDTSGSANLDELHTLNRLLQQAEDAQNNTAIKPVYLTWQINGSADVWRSEIKTGRAEPRSDALNYGYWNANTMFAPVYLERFNYWEGPEAQIALTNENGTATTNALTVYNNADGSGTSPTKAVNYVAIAGTSVTGDLPAAYRMEMVNGHGSALYDVMVGHQYISTSGFPVLYEAEAINYTEAAGTATTAGTSYSGGTALSGTIPVSDPVTGTSQIDLLGWTLGTAAVSAANAGMFHAVLRYVPGYPASTTYLRLLLLAMPTGATGTNEGQVLSQTSWTLPTANAYISNSDLGVVRIPPNLGGQTGLGSLVFVVGAMQTGSSPTLTQTFDCLYLVPADGWRRFYSLYSVGVENNQRLVDDTINGITYRDAGDGTGKTPYPMPSGEIWLQPGKAQRLYFLVGGAGNYESYITRTLAVKLYYRPRRLTL